MVVAVFVVDVAEKWVKTKKGIDYILLFLII